MITMPIELYTDGSSLKNPGASGLAYIIRYWETVEGNDMPQSKTEEGNQGFRLSTNNRMEIMAAIYGLKKIMEMVDTNPSFTGASQINLSSDSEYLCNAINQKWIQKWQQNNWMTSGFQGRQPQSVKNKDLWEQVVDIQNSLQSHGIVLTVTHVKGHSGHEFNEQADKLAVAASMDGTKHLIDEVYERTMTSYNRR